MSSPQRPLTRRLRYALETAGVYIIYLFFRALPLDMASNLGGWIGRHIGPRMHASETARKNLAAALPSADPEKIILGMWDNLGRVVAEYPHLHHIQDRVTLVGEEHMAAARNSGKPAIFFAGHIANWELPAIAAKSVGLDTHIVYRKPNNPGVDGLLRHARSAGASGHIEKGTKGAREILTVLKENGVLGILMDQKLNEGMAIPFFGRDAMTAPAIAYFALKFGCPVYPIRTERLQGAHFKMTVFPPLDIPRSGDKEKDTHAILTEINQRLESWIAEKPEQWLWIHHRWPD